MIVREGVSTSNFFRVITPCMDETPQVLLRRPFGHKFNLSLTSPSFDVNPWCFLTSQPYLKNVLAAFRLLRADVRCRFMIRSTVQQYGWYAVTSVYGLAIEEVTRRIAGPRTVIGDIQERSAVEYIVPYADPNPMMIVSDLSEEPDCLRPARVYVDLMQMASTIATQANVIEVLAYYNFENVHVSGLKAAEAQMDIVRQNPMLAAFSGVTLTGVSSLMTRGSYFMDTATKMFSSTEKMVGAAEKLKNHFTPNEGNPYRMSPFGDVATSTYQENGGLLAAKRDEYVPSADLLGISDPTAIQSIIQIPGPSYFHTLTEGDYKFLLNPVPYLSEYADSNTVNNSYMSYFARMFRLWRGSIEYSIRFFTSPFIASRVRISVTWGGTIPVDNLGGNLWSHTMTIQGSCSFNFRVPYVYQTPFRATAQTEEEFVENPIIVVELLGGITSPGDVPPSIYAVVFERAGPDFVFRGVRHPAGQGNASSLVAEAQMSLEVDQVMSVSAVITGPGASTGVLVLYDLWSYNDSGNTWLTVSWSGMSATETGTFGFKITHGTDVWYDITNRFITGDDHRSWRGYHAGTPITEDVIWEIDFYPVASSPQFHINFQIVLEKASGGSSGPIDVNIVSATTSDYLPITYSAIPGQAPAPGATDINIVSVSTTDYMPVTYTAPPPPVTTSLVAQAQMRTVDMFSDIVSVNDSVLVNDFDCSWDVKDVMDILLRYSERASDTTEVRNDIIVLTNGTYPEANMSLFDNVCRLYRYWSGGMRFKVAVPQQNNISRFELAPGSFAPPSTPSLHLGNSSLLLYSNLWNIADLEIPFYCTSLAAETIKAQDNKIPYNVPYFAFTPDVDVTQVLVSAGADFQLFILLPPPDKEELTPITGSI